MAIAVGCYRFIMVANLLTMRPMSGIISRGVPITLAADHGRFQFFAAVHSHNG